MATAQHEDTARSLAAFPAGSNGEFNLPPDLTMVIARGDGCELWDTAGKHYYDFSMGWGSVLVGHARPEVRDAVIAQAPLGSNFAYINENELAVGEELIRLSPACDRVRFCASGTEATMYCMRIARAATRRPKILKFEGAYHGANEEGVTSLFPQEMRAFPTPEPSSHGIDHNVTANVIVAPYNDADTTAAIIAAHAHELAAVIVEPLHRCLPPVEGFLPALGKACTENNVLLIFDEVVTGFRLAYGGAQEYYGVTPDLIAYGKALGGGYPIGAFGGRAGLMALVEEHRMNRAPYVWTASTLGGNPISTAAARAALGVFREEGVYEHLHGLGAYLRNGMGKVLTARGVEGTIIGDGPLAQVVFAPGPVRNYRETRRGDSEKARKVMLGLFERGIFLNPMGTKLYLSLAHTPATCDAFLDRFDQVLATL
jgi:glutamate-1-semialdehyde 2,1-aminomutase